MPKKAAEKKESAKTTSASTKASAPSQKAKGILREVAEMDRCFWMCDGQVLKSLRELASSLKSMNDDTFRYHVNSEKNDFANWVKEVIGDEELARSLSRDRAQMLNDVKKRIALLESQLKK
ncbi:hypothetical protein FJZ53_04280 [Candidatus Woesearchaeota archaeon]|nr:hypothetical protein [Candidatus Woesearchaeota archaeon]